MKPWHRPWFVVPLSLGLVFGLGSGALAAFSATTGNGANTFVAGPDWEPPHVTRTIVAKTPGYLGGKIHQGGQFFVYAQIDDGGNPPSGVGTVTTNVSAMSTGGTAVAMVAGAFSIGGVLYNFRSAVRGVTNPLAAGILTYAFTMADVVTPPNSQTQTGFTVTVDNTAPTPVDMTSANRAGGTVGLAEQGDSIRFTFSEPMDPESLIPGWDGGSPTTVQVHLQNAGRRDRLVVQSNAGVTLAFGTVFLQQNYVRGSRDFSNSSITMLGNQVTIVFGAETGTSRLVTVASPTTWTGDAGAYDAAGNACSTITITGSGSPRIDF